MSAMDIESPQQLHQEVGCLEGRPLQDMGGFATWGTGALRPLPQAETADEARAERARLEREAAERAGAIYGTIGKTTFVAVPLEVLGIGGS